MTTFPTEDVRGLSTTCLENPYVLPILADALEEAGRLDLAAQARAGQTPADVLRSFTLTPEQYAEMAEMAENARIALFRRSLFVQSGITGCPSTLTALQSRITRNRPRGSGSRIDLAKRLRDALDALAARRWKRVTKGQRKATPKQANDLLDQIDAALTSVQGRAKERKIDRADVLLTAIKADTVDGASCDGGKITCNSYGYRWETTTVAARREADGTVLVSIWRSGNPVVISAPAKWWATATR